MVTRSESWRPTARACCRLSSLAVCWQAGGQGLVLAAFVALVPACGAARPAPEHTRAVIVAGDGDLTCDARCAPVKHADERVVACLYVPLPSEQAHRFDGYSAQACMLERVTRGGEGRQE